MYPTELRAALKSALPRVSREQHASLAQAIKATQGVSVMPMSPHEIAKMFVRCFSAEVGEGLDSAQGQMTPRMTAFLQHMEASTLAKLALGIDLYLRERNSREGRITAAREAWLLLMADASCEAAYVWHPLSY